MGNVFSISQHKEIVTTEYKLPDCIDGISAYEDEFIYFTRSGFFEVFSKDESISSRLLSMHPTSVCSTTFHTFIIGFRNGFISEFDSQMNLLTTYTLPGTFTAHNDMITQIGSCPQFHLMSISTDKSMHFWNSKGLHMSTITSNFMFTAFCVSSDFLWLADSRPRMYVCNLSSLNKSSKKKQSFKKLKSFDLSVPGIVVAMAPIGDGNACIAAMRDGMILILSTSAILDIFNPFSDHVRIMNICPLRVDFRTGLISYAVVDSSGNFNLVALNHVVKNLGQIAPFFTSNETDILSIRNGQIVRFNKKQLESDSVKRLPELDLPRSKIVNCLNYEDELQPWEEEEEPEEDMNDEQDKEEDKSN